METKLSEIGIKSIKQYAKARDFQKKHSQGQRANVVINSGRTGRISTPSAQDIFEVLGIRRVA